MENNILLALLQGVNLGQDNSLFLDKSNNCYDNGNVDLSSLISFEKLLNHQSQSIQNNENLSDILNNVASKENESIKAESLQNEDFVEPTLANNLDQYSNMNNSVYDNGLSEDVSATNNDIFISKNIIDNGNKNLGINRIIFNDLNKSTSFVNSDKLPSVEVNSKDIISNLSNDNLRKLKAINELNNIYKNFDEAKTLISNDNNTNYKHNYEQLLVDNDVDKYNNLIKSIGLKQYKNNSISNKDNNITLSNINNLQESNLPYDIKSKDSNLLNDVKLKDNNLLNDIKLNDNNLLSNVNLKNNNLLSDIKLKDSSLLEITKIKDNNLLSNVELKDFGSLNDVELKNDLLLAKNKLRNNDIISELDNIINNHSISNNKPINNININNSLEIKNWNISELSEIISNNVNNNQSIHVKIKDDSLGDFKIIASNSLNNNNIRLKVITNNSNVENFFNINHESIMNKLNSSGIDIANIEVVNISSSNLLSDNNNLSNNSNESRESHVGNKDHSDEYNKRKNQELLEEFEEELV